MFDPDNLAGLIDNRRKLAKFVSLIESDLEADWTKANDLILAATDHIKTHALTGKVIVLTGMPGAGKSTFINNFGLFLANQGFKIAVLAIDPSSEISAGAILGDKIRMQDLARHPNAFIRPSPSGAGYLGGLSSTTEDVTVLLKAAGFDYIFIETIGVGQNENDGCLIADHVIMLVPPATGDDIQALKRGNIEFIDLIVITKHDGDTKILAEATASEYRSSLGSNKHIILTSGLEKTGFEQIAASLDTILVQDKNIEKITQHRIEKTLFKELKKLSAIDSILRKALQTQGSTRQRTTFFINELKKLLTKAS